MKKLCNLFTSKTKFTILFYVLVHITLTFSIQIEYKSDALYYYKLAQECIQVNEFYPAKKQLYEDYIVAPLYINIIIIILKIYNSAITISLFNLAVVLLQVLLLYKITTIIFSENIARLTIVLFILYLNTLGLMLQNFTELFFLVLITASIYFYMQNRNGHLILSGIFLGGAIAVRPAAWALVFAFISLQILISVKNKKIIFNYLFIYSGILTFIFLFGGFTFLHFGKFEFTSTTGPVNLLLGANNDATGGFISTVYEKGKAGYIEYPDSLTYIQKGEFYQEQAVKWITENPVKWISLAPLKFFHTYGWDDISLSGLLGYDYTNFLRVIRIFSDEGDLKISLPETSALDKIFYFLVLLLSHLYYYLLLFAIVLGIYHVCKKKLNTDVTSLILLFSLFATLIIMITVGTPRYKYPMFILMLPFAAHYFELKLGIGKKGIEGN